MWKLLKAGSDEWAALHAKVQEKANQARSEKAKGNKNAAKERNEENSAATTGGETVSGASRDHKSEAKRKASTAKAEAAGVGCLTYGRRRGRGARQTRQRSAQ